MSSSSNFGIVDAILFTTSVVAAVLVGVYHTYKDKGKKTLSNYYYADRVLSPIPIGVSMAVTFISSMTVIGFPVMGYKNGTIVFWLGLASLVQAFMAYFYFIPFYHRVELSSVFEFLEHRFHVSIRLIISFFSSINWTLYISIVVYLTSLALTVVIPISFEACVVVTCIVCTSYTVLGGIKAVIWVDTFQSLVMVFGGLILFIMTASHVGGIEEIFEAMERGNRTTFSTFNPDPTFTLTAWTMMFGLGINWASVPLCNQTIVQRFQACRSVKDARKALFVFITLLFILLFSAGLNGVAMYAYFEGCDPKKAGEIDDTNQYIPILVAKVFHTAPGLSGIFIAAVYSGMLSTVSSVLNSMSNVITEDFARRFLEPRSNTSWLNIGKSIGIVIGIITGGIAFLFKRLGESITKVAFSIDGILGGPIFGVFLSGVFFPWVHTKGVTTGFLLSIFTNMFLMVGNKIYGPKDSSSFSTTPLSIEGCNLTVSQMANLTMSANVTTTDVTERPLIADTLFSISYMYYGTIGSTFCVIFSLIASFWFGANDTTQMNPKFFIPIVDGKWLSHSVRRAFRFGVPEIKQLQNDPEIKVQLVQDEMYPVEKKL